MKGKCSMHAGGRGRWDEDWVELGKLRRRCSLQLLGGGHGDWAAGGGERGAWLRHAR